MRARFATPSLNHTVTLEYLISALQTEQALFSRDMAHEWTQRPGDPFIAKARSSIACDFLASDCTDLFFLDDDIRWPAGKVLEFLDSSAPVMAGVYPHKLDELSFPCSLMQGADGGLIERGGLYQAVLAPTGFMRIKRWVLEKLYEKAPPYRETEADGKTYERRAIFNSGPAQDGNWWGEDYAFCNACHAENIDIWIDPDIPFYHRGQKRYEARMSDSIHVFVDKAKQRSTAA